MISSTITKTTSNKKYDEEGWMGSSSPLATLLRRIGGGLPQMGTDDGGGGALGHDDVEDDDYDGSLGLGPSTIHDEYDGAGGATRGGNDGIGRVTAATTS